MKKIFIFLVLLLASASVGCKANENSSIRVFIHVCTINHWQDVLERQLKSLKNSGLYEQCHSISLGVLGDGDMSQFIELYPKLSILFQLSDTSFKERPTLLALHQFCRANPNSKILYLNSNEAGHTPINEDITKNSRYMEFFTIECWRDCIEALKVHDACGVNYCYSPPHFKGNFWWASAKYISTLSKDAFFNCEPELCIGLRSPDVKCLDHSEASGKVYPEFVKQILNKQYILAAIPQGPLGMTIHQYWDKIKNTNLTHDYIKNSPPHCKMTGIFTSNLSKAEFNILLQDILKKIKNRNVSRKVNVAGLVMGKLNQEMDFIKLISPFLKEFTKEFILRQHLPQSIIQGYDQPLHIALRRQKFSEQNKLIRIHNLQKNIHLKSNAKWRICIYKLIGGKLQLFASCPVNP